MGIFDDFRAVKNVQDIKKGKTAKLSVAQLACLLINLPDASKNLSAEQFKQVNSLYDEYRKFNTKVIMDMDSYLATSLKIVKSFNCIAFYGKYSGGNLQEYSFWMPELTTGQIEDIWELQGEIQEMEASIHTAEKSILDNQQVLKDAFSDDDLRKLVSAGQFPANQVEQYKKQRENLHLLVTTLVNGLPTQKNALEQKKTALHKLKKSYIDGVD